MYSKDIIDRFSKVATASVADACDQAVGRRCFMDYDICPRINDKKVVGPAVTIQEGPANGENVGPTHALDAIEAANPGDVMVISLANSDKNVAIWGGIMTSGAYAKEMAGTILDAGVRDTTEIKRDYDYPVFARSVSPGTTLGRYKSLAANVPVICGGVEVNPGDLIVADADGVVVVPKDKVDEVLKITEEIEAREALQAKLIVESKSIAEGMAKYNRI
jgi:4-hydroxy-4-methyl-2-oxoglutarate aldolase